MTVQFFDIKKQNEAVIQELDSAIKNVVTSGGYILGETVAAFEKSFADYCGTKYAVGVASGTDALHLALLAAGVKPGDEVICPTFTFVATAEAIVFCGAKPIFCDLDPKTFNLDLAGIDKRVTRNTKAILPVHLYGLACDMNEVIALARKYNLSVVEDCAQATGAEYKKQKVGSFGLGAFSFFPTKNLGCFGDGGAITTDDENIYNELKVLRNHGSRSQYHHDIIGFNSRLDALQAAVLNVKLPHLNNYLASRRNNADNYRKYLTSVTEISLPTEPTGHKHTYNQFTMLAKERDQLQKFLIDNGIASMVYYPISLHLQEAFKGLGYKCGDFPNSEAIQKQVLSMPIFPELSQISIEEVCAAIKKFYAKK